jgi:hypothetical protein
MHVQKECVVWVEILSMITSSNDELGGVLHPVAYHLVADFNNRIFCRHSRGAGKGLNEADQAPA